MVLIREVPAVKVSRALSICLSFSVCYYVGARTRGVARAKLHSYRAVSTVTRARSLACLACRVIDDVTVGLPTWRRCYAQATELRRSGQRLTLAPQTAQRAMYCRCLTWTCDGRPSERRRDAQVTAS